MAAAAAKKKLDEWSERNERNEGNSGSLAAAMAEEINGILELNNERMELICGAANPFLEEKWS